MKRKTLFEEFSKESEIDKQKENHDNRSKTKRKNESKKQTRYQKESKKARHHMNLKSKIRQKQKQNFFLLLTKRRKNIDLETLK